jgi:GTP cyclohydrolase FolE2
MVGETYDHQQVQLPSVNVDAELAWLLSYLSVTSTCTFAGFKCLRRQQFMRRQVSLLISLQVPGHSACPHSHPCTETSMSKKARCATGSVMDMDKGYICAKGQCNSAKTRCKCSSAQSITYAG